jgi:hypothetical protein
LRSLPGEGSPSSVRRAAIALSGSVAASRRMRARIGDVAGSGRSRPSGPISAPKGGRLSHFPSARARSCESRTRADFLARLQLGERRLDREDQLALRGEGVHRVVDEGDLRAHRLDAAEGQERGQDGAGVAVDVERDEPVELAGLDRDQQAAELGARVGVVGEGRRAVLAEDDGAGGPTRRPRGRRGRGPALRGAVGAAGALLRGEGVVLPWRGSRLMKTRGDRRILSSVVRA